MAERRFGVFLMSDQFVVDGMEDGSIRLFDSGQEAERFILESLVAAGLIDESQHGWTVDGHLFDDASEAVDSVRDNFGVTEFFHAYPVSE